MFYSDSVQQSSEYLRMALGFIGRYDIPADPLNYTVWYEHVSGKNKDLSTAIENILNGTGSVTPELNQTLYRQYIADARAIIVDVVREEFRNILIHLNMDITDTESSIGNSGQVVRAFSKKLEETLDIDAIRGITERIAQEISSLEACSGQFRDRLKKASREVEELQGKVERIRKEAETDSLTGLANRRSFEKQIATAMANAVKSRSDLCLIMADIDHFKQVNDTYGHLVGDHVLRLTGQVIGKMTRGNDFSARYGGEEFVILLSETSIRGAMIVAEKIRRYFEKTRMTKKKTGEEIGTVTLSMGISHLMNGDTPESMIQRADQALYAAKNSGRNRIALDDSRLLN